MIVVDSSVWIDYFNGTGSKQALLLREILGVQEIIVGDIILTEVLQGFKIEKEFKEAKRQLEKCTIVNMVGHQIAILAAENYRKLRKNGITIRRTMDIIIATYCINHSFVLLHSDKDFNPLEDMLGLKPFNFLYH